MLSKLHRNLLSVCIVIFCLAGAWMSGQLVQMHDRGPSADSSHPGLLARLCRSVAGGESGCEGTVHSAWSEISFKVPVLTGGLTVSLRGVTLPVAFVGLAYFVCLGAWFALIGGPRPRGGAWHRMVLAVAICGVGASSFFLGLMAFGRAPWCVGCALVHVVNLLLVAAIWILCVAPVPTTPSQDSALPLMPAMLSAREAWTAILVALVLVAGLYSYRHESLVHRNDVRLLEPYKEIVLSLQRDPELLIKAYLAQPWHRIDPRGDEAKSPSRHHLVMFTDFECEACYLHSHIIRDQVTKAFNGDLTVWIRNFPLCTNCNKQVKANVHPNACRAACAAEAARLQRGQLAFELVYGLLYANRKQLTDNIYRYIAVQIALEPEGFLKKMEDPAVRQIVQDDIALGQELGVDGTPTMFLDGRRVPALCLIPEFWQAAAKLPDRTDLRHPAPATTDREDGGGASPRTAAAH
jgi:predicted DsbA family dithiol-disulfide isomerase